MYEAFYNFKEKPFSLTPDPDFLYLSPGHKKALAYLEYGLRTGEGFVVVTGEIGSGKTTIVRRLIRDLQPEGKLAYVVNPRGSFRQLMRIVMDEFGVVPVAEEASRERLLGAFKELVFRRNAGGAPARIIIDEAQNLDIGTLEEVRMLSNLETDKAKLVQIVLVGQPELREILQAPELKQLNQRISIKFHLEPLSLDETARYITHRLHVAAGGDAPVRFSTGAVRSIHGYSLGVPRKINIACNAVLVAGCLDEKTSFNAEYVRQTVFDLDGTAEFGAAQGDDRFDEPEPSPEPAPAKADAAAAETPADERAEQAPAPPKAEDPKPDRPEPKPRRLVRKIAFIGATAAAAAGAAYWLLF